MQRNTLPASVAAALGSGVSPTWLPRGPSGNLRALNKLHSEPQRARRNHYKHRGNTGETPGKLRGNTGETHNIIKEKILSQPPGKRTAFPQVRSVFLAAARFFLCAMRDARACGATCRTAFWDFRVPFHAVVGVVVGVLRFFPAAQRLDDPAERRKRRHHHLSKKRGKNPVPGKT